MAPDMPPAAQQPPAATVATVPAAVVPAVVPVSIPPAQTTPQLASPLPAVAAAPAEPFGGVKEGMPYGLARQKLATVGWQTGFFGPAANITESDRDNRAYFIDHRMMEVEDCSASGCAMQFHNTDGRLLYVFTQPGSRDSDAYHGAGPAVIGMCLDHKDLACTPDDGATQTQAKR